MVLLKYEKKILVQVEKVLYIYIFFFLLYYSLIALISRKSSKANFFALRLFCKRRHLPFSKSGGSHRYNRGMNYEVRVGH